MTVKTVMTRLCGIDVWSECWVGGGREGGREGGRADFGGAGRAGDMAMNG
jgi:hypothetical protein